MKISQLSAVNIAISAVITLVAVNWAVRRPILFPYTEKDSPLVFISLLVLVSWFSTVVTMKLTRYQSQNVAALLLLLLVVGAFSMSENEVSPEPFVISAIYRGNVFLVRSGDLLKLDSLLIISNIPITHGGRVFYSSDPIPCLFRDFSVNYRRGDLIGEVVPVGNVTYFTACVPVKYYEDYMVQGVIERDGDLYRVTYKQFSTSYSYMVYYLREYILLTLLIIVPIYLIVDWAVSRMKREEYPEEDELVYRLRPLTGALMSLTILLSISLMLATSSVFFPGGPVINLGLSLLLVFSYTPMLNLYSLTLLLLWALIRRRWDRILALTLVALLALSLYFYAFSFHSPLIRVYGVRNGRFVQVNGDVHMSFDEIRIIHRSLKPYPHKVFYEVRVSDKPSHCFEKSTPPVEVEGSTQLATIKVGEGRKWFSACVFDGMSYNSIGGYVERDRVSVRYFSFGSFGDYKYVNTASYFVLYTAFFLITVDPKADRESGIVRVGRRLREWANRLTES